MLEPREAHSEFLLLYFINKSIHDASSISEALRCARMPNFNQNSEFITFYLNVTRTFSCNFMKSKSLLKWRKRAFRRQKEHEKFRVNGFAKLKRLEEEIPKLKAKKREEAMQTYRQLLGLLKDEPIFLTRYE